MKLPQEFDLHALEVFVMTVELGGMSQCASHLQVTQSAVSQTIAKLEAGIGASLFDRTMRPLGLTASGKSLFARGQKLIAHARLAYDEVREGANLPISSITVAMSFSLANQLTAPILHSLGARADRWNIRSGISMEHQGEFLARDIDMLVTGSFNLEHRDTVELHPVFEESFILVFPKDFREPLDLVGLPSSLPFIRFSQLTGTGQQIERQIVRMKLKLPQMVEVESSHQQLALVAAGIGWAITTPVCLAAVPELLSQLRAEPMTRGRFSRSVQVVARIDELGNIPSLTAALCQQVLQEKIFPPLIEEYPWMAQQLAWPSASAETAELIA
ncbi:LysR family transcriptional regulator [Sphingorhabdus sp.]|jgi:DNA-binding transcriptional LysR family regulator|uniref:LysR family transcriptional regulator n=1 Tax=Sphingorhabdus sp. TaxID=1902408 RepID=UPI002FDB417F|nr:LysR family transcriptional regulator [Sphingomonadaceae bacterium]